MKRTAFLLILSALSLPLVTTSALGQDAPPNPEGGDTTGSSPDAMGSDADAVANTPAAADTTVAAPESGPQKPISVGLLLGYGISLESGGNPWGLGFGARGGYNLGKIYLGARFVFYLGESESAAGAGFAGAASKVSVNIWELGIEGGYDVDLSGITLRPELGLGLASLNVDASGGTVSISASSTDLYIAPGVSVLYDVTPDIFLGLDTRFQFILDTGTPKALIFLANGGMHF